MKQSKQPTTTQDSSDRERATFHLPKSLTERARNIVYWTPGLTMASLVTDALSKHIDQLEKKNGGPFEHRGANLKGGRPVRT